MLTPFGRIIVLLLSTSALQTMVSSLLFVRKFFTNLTKDDIDFHCPRVYVIHNLVIIYQTKKYFGDLNNCTHGECNRVLYRSRIIQAEQENAQVKPATRPRRTRCEKSKLLRGIDLNYRMLSDCELQNSVCFFRVGEAMTGNVVIVPQMPRCCLCRWG